MSIETVRKRLEAAAPGPWWRNDILEDGASTGRFTVGSEVWVTISSARMGGKATAKAADDRLRAALTAFEAAP